MRFSAATAAATSMTIITTWTIAAITARTITIRTSTTFSARSTLFTRRTRLSRHGFQFHRERNLIFLKIYAQDSNRNLVAWVNDLAWVLNELMRKFRNMNQTILMNT